MKKALWIALFVTLSLIAGVWWYLKKKKIPLNQLFASTGNSPVVLEDYEITGSKVTLSLSNGKAGNINVEFRQGNTVVTSQKLAYASSVSLVTTAFGYMDVWVDNTDIGSIYLPFQLEGEWVVEKAKSVDETATMNLQFTKAGNKFIVTDSNDDTGWANVEFWHGTTLLGNAIPQGYSVEPMVDQHITKKRWGNFAWFGADHDGKNREIAQLTFKIVPKP